MAGSASIGLLTVGGWSYSTNNVDIAVINADGSGHRILDTGDDGGFNHTPSWSRDGR
jgi:hypothetical protein